MNNSNKNIKIKVNAITRLLELIEGVNKDIDLSQSIGSKSMVKQYLHLKKGYTKQLLEVLSEYQLPVAIAETD